MTVHDRTGNATFFIPVSARPSSRRSPYFSYERVGGARAEEHNVRVINREYEGKLIFRIVRRYTLKLICRAIARDPLP